MLLYTEYSFKINEFSMRYGDLTNFKMADVHLEFYRSKYGLFVGLTS